ncbi:MAG: ribonuclease HIII [Turicibacter sp.]|nr:ribonuclease HIII [Turicibacter sp.]
MATITLTVSKETLEKMHAHYEGQIIKVPPYSRFQAKTSHCVVTAYNSLKVVFQGSDPEAEAYLWQLPPVGEEPQSPPIIKATGTLPSNIARLSAVGCDEVGTGDYFGPLVVCCAYVPEHLIEPFLKIGIRDSKDYKDPKICELAEKIKGKIPHQTIVLPNAKYNEMVAKGMNANSIKAYLHNLALKKLVQSLPEYPEYIVMDEFVNGRKYFSYLKELPKKPEIIQKNLHFIQKGESVHVAVAAASILARESFVKYMDLVGKQLDFTLPKGAGPIVDRAGRELVKKFGKAKLEEYSKFHFANTGKILK